MLTPLSSFDILIMSNANVVKSVNTRFNHGPRKSIGIRHIKLLTTRVEFFLASPVRLIKSLKSRVGRLAGKNRLGSVSNFTTKDMAAKAVPDQTAPASEPSRHIVAVATGQNVAWKVCPDIGFNVDSGRSINRPSELSTSLRRRWC